MSLIDAVNQRKIANSSNTYRTILALSILIAFTLGFATFYLVSINGMFDTINAPVREIVIESV